MVEFVEVVLIEITRMANTSVDHDNNIIVSEVEVLDI
jgi:hypothetical protein